MYDYDAQIKRLTATPSLIFYEWSIGEGLFQHCSKSGRAESDWCGCLTQVRNGLETPDPALTARIRADERIPEDAHDIRPEHLPVFKEWQEELDRTIRVEGKE